MIFLNEKEEQIIGKFMMYPQKYEVALTLRWIGKGEIIAKFDSFMEDENDYEPNDKNYEEFWSLLFSAIKIMRNPPVSIAKNKDFLINYHNFPDEILVDGKKIN